MYLKNSRFAVTLSFPRSVKTSTTFYHLKITIMKPIFVRLLIYVAPLAFAQNAAAQTNSNLFLTPTSMAAASVNFAIAEADVKALAGLMKISDILYARFTTEYKNATAISYHEAKKRVMINFKIDDITNRALYTHKGKFLHNIRYYDHRMLDEAIREQVLDAFPRYTICSGVVEVNALGRKAFIVTIEGKQTWKKVKVLNTEVSVLEDFVKLPGQTFKD